MGEFHQVLKKWSKNSEILGLSVSNPDTTTVSNVSELHRQYKRTINIFCIPSMNSKDPYSFNLNYEKQIQPFQVLRVGYSPNVKFEAPNDIILSAGANKKALFIVLFFY